VTEIDKKSKPKLNKLSKDIEATPLLDLRIALMVMFLGVSSIAFLFKAPVIISITAGALTGGIWAFAKERKLMIQLITAWKTELLVAAPIVAFTAYGILEVSLQLASDMALKSGGINASNPPEVFVWLLALKALTSAINPAIAGIAGGILLGITEELFWRGFVQTRLMMTTGHGVATLITSTIYSIYYLFIMGTIAAVLAFMLGMAMSLLVVRSKSLLPAILTHFIFLIFVIWLRPDVNIMF